MLKNFAGLLLTILYRLFKPLPQYMNWYFHDPSADLFESLVKWGVKHGYRFISLDECKAVISGEVLLDDKAVFISLDDGWKSNLALIPICEKYNVPITIFLTVDAVWEGNFWWEYSNAKGVDVDSLKPLTYEKFRQTLACLKEGVSLQRSAIDWEDFELLSKHPLVSLQSHTLTHPFLTSCPDDVLNLELAESKRRLEKLCGKPVTAFSYPCGEVSARECGAVKDAGYSIAFTTEQRHINIPGKNIYLVPRMSLNTFGGKYENIARTLGIFQILKLIPI